MDLPGLRKFLTLDAIAQPDLWVPTESTAEVMRWRLSVRYGVLPLYRSSSSGSNCAPEVSYGTPIMFRFYTVTSTATTPRRAAVVVTWQTDSVVIVRRLRFGSVYTKACALKGFLQTNEECPHFTGNSFSYSRLHGGHIDYEMSSKLLVWEKILRCFLKTNFVQKELSFSFIKAILLERNFKKGLWA